MVQTRLNWRLLFLCGCPGTAGVDALRLALFAVGSFAALRPVAHESVPVLDWQAGSMSLSPADCLTPASRQLRH